MPPSRALAVPAAGSPLQPHTIDRRTVRPGDVQLDVSYCGICHSDIHQARNEWGGGIYPMVPGHEIVGRVTAVGSAVSRFAPGQTVGVGCFVDACRQCRSCRAQQQQYCSDGGPVSTYNSTERGGGARTFGGYSGHMVVDQDFVLRIDAQQELSGVAPLLCAGITTYAPLRRWAPQPGRRVGVMGLGGLGHMAVKLAAAMGHEVCMLSTSEAKRADAKRLGAHDFCRTDDKQAAKRLASRFDVLIDTVSAPHDLNQALGWLDVHGTLVMLGAVPQLLPVQAMSLIGGARQLAGWLVGGIEETQHMLDFCAAKKITADIEMCRADAVNQAYQRVIDGDVKYRFVIDMATL